MTEFLVEPNPQIIISNADVTELSLLSFHIIVIVEPDPETWMIIPDGNYERKLSYIIELFNTGLDAELDLESEIYLGNDKAITHPPEIQEPHVIWIRYTDDDNYFDDAAAFCNVTFRFFDYDDTANLKFYLEGIRHFNPTWKVGVVGGMFEDDVIRIANFISEIGFSTTVVTRQCMSRNAFINLDELANYKAWLDRFGIMGNDLNSNLDDEFED